MSVKLSDDEVKQLREALKDDLAGLVDDAADIPDLLDYTFAMISSGKTLSYMQKELEDLCNEAAAKHICAKLNEQAAHNDTSAPTTTDSDGKGTRVVSLKVGWTFQIVRIIRLDSNPPRL